MYAGHAGKCKLREFFAFFFAFVKTQLRFFDRKISPNSHIFNHFGVVSEAENCLFYAKKQIL